MRLSHGIAAGILAAGAGLALTRTAAHERITTTVTWDREISSIVQARCQNCHHATAQSTMPLMSYTDARPWARAIKHEVLTRRMPIWHAARGYGDFLNDPSLSPFEIALIVAWVDGGAPKSLPAVPAGGAAAPVPALVTPASPAAPVPGAVSASRAFGLRCGEQPLTPGQLFGLKPQMATGGSMKVVMVWPNGRREILGWFRDFNPEHITTYWLRTPVAVPRGARIIADAPAPCTLTVMLLTS